MLTHKHACNSILLMYEKSGFMKPEKPLGHSVAKEFNKDITGTRLAALYAFVDEYIALLRLVSYYFVSTMTDGDKTGVTFYRLTIRQIKILSSIRLLCTYGLDTDARLQLRALYENSIIWSRFRIDDAARKQFDLANTPEKSNIFWHEYMSRAKSEKYLESEFKKNGITWFGGDNDMIKDLKHKIGPAAHPSFLSSYFDSVHDWNYSEDADLIATSIPSNASHLTLSNAILATIIPLSIKPDPPYNLIAGDLLDGTSVSPLVHPTALGDDYFQKVRDMFPILFLMAVRFIEKLCDSHGEEE